jgi:hypothetical protein
VASHAPSPNPNPTPNTEAQFYRHNFLFRPPYPSTPSPDWRPWSQFPRTGTFSLAFSFNPATAPGPERYEVNVVDQRNVIFNDDDSDDEADHRLIVGGTPIIDVRENSADGNEQVGFENICRLPTGTITGFVTLTRSVGTGDRGGEGYLTLRVDRLSAKAMSGRQSSPPLRCKRSC